MVAADRINAGTAAAIGKEIVVQRSVVTLFPKIHCVIAAAREFAGEAALIRNNVAAVIARIALFAGILHGVSAARQRAIQAAHISAGVIVAHFDSAQCRGSRGIRSAGAVVAFLEALPDSVTADCGYFDPACAVARIAVIALRNAVAAVQFAIECFERRSAGLATVASADAEASKVALLVLINHRIAAEREFDLAGTAATVPRSGVAVVALLGTFGP